MRFTLVTALMLSLLLPTTSCAQYELIESVSTQYSRNHPGLNSYRVKLKTNKIDEMLNRMTASMPKDMPRPDSPELMKFWSRTGGSVIRSNAASAFPYMQQMINRFSKRFAIDLGSLFLPADMKAERTGLLKLASVKSAEAQIADQKTHHFEIVFKEPTDLAGAFYGIALDLPQRQITKLALDIDPQKKTLVHMEIESVESVALAVEIRHFEDKGNSLPSEVTITSPDGSIEESMVTTFKDVDTYHLPVKQERKIRRPGLDEELLVEFYDYEINK